MIRAFFLLFMGALAGVSGCVSGDWFSAVIMGVWAVGVLYLIDEENARKVRKERERQRAARRDCYRW